MGRRKRPGAPLLFALGAVVLLLSASWSLCAGVSGYSLWDMLSSLLSGGGTAAHILLYVRLPRTLAALAAGAGLAVSGASSTIQTSLPRSFFSAWREFFSFPWEKQITAHCSPSARKAGEDPVTD